MEVATQFLTIGNADEPVSLLDKSSLPGCTLAYETWGELNEDKSNAILLFHALSGTQHAMGTNSSLPEADGRWTPDLHPGWWEDFIGSGKAIDTDKFFVICANYLGGCYGSTGPFFDQSRNRKAIRLDLPQTSHR